MNKLNVLHVSPAPPQLGGMEAYMGNLLASTLVQKHHILLLNISKPRLFLGGVYDIKTGYAGAFRRKLSITLTSYAYSLKFFLQFLWLLMFRNIDIVHIHTASYTSFWEKCMYIQVAKAARCNVVLHVHGALFQEFYEKSSIRIRRLIRRFLNKCDAVIALSESWKDFLATLLPDDKIHVVKNGINMKPFDGRKEHDGPVHFLHLGEVSRRKGVYDVLEAAGRLKKNGHVFQFDIVGPGELEDVRTAADKAGVSELATLHGPSRGEQKYDFFRNADCFILASYGEGLPISILESLAAGLPIISTTVGGIPEVIADGENGYLLQPGDIDQLHDAMVQIVEDSEKRERMGRNNYDYAREHYDIERCVDKISAIYRRLSAR